MANEKHTKGPWQLVGKTAIYAGLGHEVAAVRLDESARANARLIAAAPDMYEALKAHSRNSETNPCHSGPSCRCTWHMTERAIKKAETGE